MTSDQMFLETEAQRREYVRVHKLGAQWNAGQRTPKLETYDPDKDELSMVCGELGVEIC